MRFNFRKIASVLSSAVMMSSTVALAAAATYPAPFVKSGSADVGVVFGSAPGAQLDLAAVVDLTSDLQYRLASQTATSGTTSSGTTVSGGDYAKLAKPSDNINLGDTVAGVFGSSVTNDDLPVLLADGSYTNDENTEYDYEQKLTLGSLTLTHFADSDYNDKEPTVGFRVTSGTPILNYTLDFTTDAESDISSGELVDFETTDINILGRSYYILDAKNGTSTNSDEYLGKFTFLDSANTAIISEGETQTVSLGDSSSYEVGINFIGSSSVRLDINGEITNSLSAGGTYKLSDGTYVGVKDILYNAKDTGVSKVELSLGTGKLEIDSGSEVELNDDDIDGLYGYIYGGGYSGDKRKMDKLVIEWIADDEEYIANGEGSLTLPGFGAVQFTAGEFFMPYAESIKVENDGQDSIELTVPIKDGDASFNILYGETVTGNFTGLGKDSDEKLATSATSTLLYNATSGADKWFVVSWASSADSESYLLSATVSESGGKNRTSIKNEVTGDNVCVDKADGDTCNIGSASVTVTTVSKVGSYRTVLLTAGTGVTFNHIFTKQGLKIYLPVINATANVTSPQYGHIVMTPTSGDTAGHSWDSFNLYMVGEDKDDNIEASGAGYFNVTLNDNADNELQASDISSAQSEHELGDTNVYETYTVSDTAIKGYISTNGDQDTVEVVYAGGESFIDVFLASENAQVESGSSGSTGGSVTQLGNIAVSDAEVSSVSSKNLIVVGGSCVNSFAAQLLGVSYPTCGSNWQSATNVGSGSYLVQTFARSGNKVATLVAGYNAGDTASGIKKLTSEPGSFDISAGKAYTGDQSSVTMVDVSSA